MLITIKYCHSSPLPIYIFFICCRIVYCLLCQVIRRSKPDSRFFIHTCWFVIVLLLLLCASLSVLATRSYDVFHRRRTGCLFVRSERSLNCTSQGALMNCRDTGAANGLLSSSIWYVHPNEGCSQNAVEIVYNRVRAAADNGSRGDLAIVRAVYHG